MQQRNGGAFMFDVIIIGAGPAGLTACLYSLRFRLKTLVIDKMQMGGYLNFIDNLENYPGFAGGISGVKLTEQIIEQLKQYDFQHTQAQVESIEKKSQGHWELKTSKDTLKTKAIIIACGTQPKKLGVPGEEEFLGKGVSYCAICDAPFFRNKEVFVVGGGNTALEEALYLSKFASKVTVVHRRSKFRADEVFVEKAKKNEKINFLLSSVCTAIEGKGVVQKVKIKSADGKLSEINANGIFIFVGMKPQTEFLRGLIKMDESGYIITNEEFVTTTEGIFAAGDCRKNSLRQVIAASGEGAKAAYSAHKMLVKY